MADNNKYSVDLSMPNGTEQIKNHKAAFDELRDCIAGLYNPITKLNSSVSTLFATVEKLNSQNRSAGDVLGNIKSSFDKTEFAVGSLKKGFDALKNGVSTLTGALTGWINVLFVLTPALLEWLGSLTKSNDAIDKAKASLSAMNGALQSSDYTNASKQLNQLKTHVELAGKGFLNKKEVLKEYNSSVGKTMGAVSNLKELEDKLTKDGPAYIKMTMLKAAAQLALQDAAKKAYEVQQLQLQSDEDSANFTDHLKAGLKNFFTSSVEFTPDHGDNYDKDLKRLGAERKSALIKNAEKATEDLEDVARKYEAEAAEIAKKSGLNFFNGEFRSESTKKSSEPKKETYDYEAMRQRALAEYQKTVDEFNRYLDNQRTNKNGYEKELKELKLQLDKKWITQEEYYKRWAAIQERYHADISESVKMFHEQALAETLQHQKDLVDAENQKKLMGEDEQAVKKAFLPKDKLEAEKKLIFDKYEFERQKAVEAGKDTAEIRQRYRDEVFAAEKQHEQDRKNFQIETAQQVSNAAFSILQNDIRAQSSARLKQLQTQKESGLSNTSLTATQRKVIEEKYKKKEAEEKVKAFKAEQRASILQAVINGALAITKVTAQAGLLGAFVIPGIIASTAIQVATIAAQKTPQYAKGGMHYKSDGKGALLSGYSRTDDTNAYLRSGEAVVVSEAMRNPWARNLVSAINVAHGGRDFSVANTGRGYAIGGIFTDGGNANRYYSQPANDVKDLANTLAYQMINNFPPVYVDVKDINTQQSILAKTVDRVNL